MQGHTDLERPRTRATLTHDVKKKQDRRYYLRGRVERADDGTYRASLPYSQSSALLTAAHRGNCFVVLPQGEGVFPEGTEVDCIRLDMEEGVQ
jgi:molybdopterin molybdotransferase